jgi:hypothetical protein
MRNFIIMLVGAVTTLATQASWPYLRQGFHDAFQPLTVTRAEIACEAMLDSVRYATRSVNTLRSAEHGAAVCRSLVRGNDSQSVYAEAPDVTFSTETDAEIVLRVCTDVFAWASAAADAPLSQAKRVVGAVSSCVHTYDDLIAHPGDSTLVIARRLYSQRGTNYR